uniref:Protein kinase domain-containing protein n=1 Tax=Panagrolaimus sp. JU765 TaxID=591449 RepID=A0AC34QEW6_9BILA
MTDDDSFNDEVLNDESAESSVSLHDSLTTVCTIGTGTFGRVELTKHSVTGQYYALKALYIPEIVAKRQVDHVHNEKRVLQRLSHPFIVELFDTAKDSRNLYMVLEFLAGGELFSYLRMSKSFPSGMVKFYAAEIVLALSYLHSLNIAYRDLKPENLLLTHDGHIKMTDFGFAKEIHNKSYTVCGTPEYLAPEIISRRGHNQSVDWWSLGVLIFELMTGKTPFPGKSAKDVQDAINANDGHVEFPPRTFSSNAKSIVSRLLRTNPRERLGDGPNGADAVKSHPWFETLFTSLEWDLLDYAKFGLTFGANVGDISVPSEPDWSAAPLPSIKAANQIENSTDVLDFSCHFFFALGTCYSCWPPCAVEINYGTMSCCCHLVFSEEEMLVRVVNNDLGNE